MKEAVVFEAPRTGYSISQLFEGYSWNKPMTVGQLIGILEDFDDDAYVVISHDNGYTFGGLNEPHYYTQDDEEDDFEIVW